MKIDALEPQIDFDSATNLPATLVGLSMCSTSNNRTLVTGIASKLVARWTGHIWPRPRSAVTPVVGKLPFGRMELLVASQP